MHEAGVRGAGHGGREREGDVAGGGLAHPVEQQLLRDEACDAADQHRGDEQRFLAGERLHGPGEGRAAAGSHTVNVLPAPGTVSTVMCPPCSSAKSRAIARPRPVPPSSRLRDWSIRKKRSKIRSTCSGAMPGPVSRTLAPTTSPFCRSANVMLPPGVRSEERRVGKEGRSRWPPYH